MNAGMPNSDIIKLEPYFVLLTPQKTRLYSGIARVLTLVALVAVGQNYFIPPAAHLNWLYWAGSGVLAFTICFGGHIQTWIAHWHFHGRVRNSLPGSGVDLEKLTNSAVTLHEGHEERALYVLQNMTLRTEDPNVLRARQYLMSLAAARWMARQKPGRALSGLYQSHPQIHALIFSVEPTHIPIRLETLHRELKAVTTEELDGLARDYIVLVDMLIAALDRGESPFGDEAERLLSFCTGKTFTLNVRQRFAAWWASQLPVIRHGGGAYLLGMRLLQRECYSEAASLLKRLGNGGMLSGETDTIQRAAAFLTLFSRPLWRMTGSDIPQYFREGCYYLAGEMGVLRFPTAELPEVARSCQHGEFYHASKRRLIEDALDLWSVAGDEIAAPISLLLKRLLEHKGQRCSARLSYWRDAWGNTRGTFEQSTRVLMRGVAATASGDLASAEKHFTHAAQLDPHSSVPLVNLVHIFRLGGRDAQAETLLTEILHRFPRDGQTLVALGRLALQKNDTVSAHKYLIMALDYLEPATEALIWLGEVKLAEGLYLESQHYYDYAKQLDDQLPEPKFGLARIYMETQRYDLAIENLNSIVERGPDAARDLALYMLYRAYRQKNDDARAFDFLDKISAQFFKEPDLLDDIAVHLEGEKRYSKAREFAERAMLLRAGRKQSTDDGESMSGAF